MNKNPVTEARIIQLTMEVVHSFYQRQPDTATVPMTDDFMWIGANDFQWCENLADFNRITENEYGKSPVILSDEEFHLLFHERNVWVVYGRYIVSSAAKNGSAIDSYVRGTYVWRKINGRVQLVHAHSSNAGAVEEQIAGESPIVDYLKHMNPLNPYIDKISFRDRDGGHRYLFPGEILYIKAEGQRSRVFLKHGEFQATGILASHEEKLPAYFKRVQKSYVVNTYYIESIYRYKAILTDGREVPVGKDWYMELKQWMREGGRLT